MTPVLLLVLHAVVVAVAAPSLAGLRARAEARWRGVEGPDLAQPGRDILRLWRKTSLLPGGASVLFAAAPVFALATAVAAVLLVPSFALGSAAAPAADLLVVGALLAASRGVLLLASWDSGSGLAVNTAAGTMEARLGAAPVLLLVGLAAALLCGSTNLEAAATAVRDGGPGARIAGVLAGLALLTLGAERDGDPGPWSGRLRALVTLSLPLRNLASLGLAATLGCPFGLPTAPEAGPVTWFVGLACWGLKLGVLGLGASAVGAPRLALPAGALLALMAVLVASLQGTA